MPLPLVIAKSGSATDSTPGGMNGTEGETVAHISVLWDVVGATAPDWRSSKDWLVNSTRRMIGFHLSASSGWFHKSKGG